MRYIAEANNKNEKPTGATQIKYINVFEVAEKAGVHFSTIRRWVLKGKLNGYKMDRKLLFDREEVDKLIKQKAIKPRQFPAA